MVELKIWHGKSTGKKGWRSLKVTLTAEAVQRDT